MGKVWVRQQAAGPSPTTHTVNSQPQFFEPCSEGRAAAAPLPVSEAVHNVWLQLDTVLQL